MAKQTHQRIPFDTRVGNFACFLEGGNDGGDFSGTGFLYEPGARLTPVDDRSAPDLWKSDGLYVVTNRHVVFDLSEDEKRPSEFFINIRTRDDSTGLWEWQELKLSDDEIDNSIYVHDDPDIDVAVIDISARKKEVPKGLTIKSEDLIHQHKIARVECADDVIAIGFPRGFYDQMNHFPIVKRGIIASEWGANFEGEPFFLIDAKLFPGSSGSAVMTKPADHMIVDGNQYESKSGKQSVLLGVYSGEPYLGDETSPEYVDVGIVWYSKNISEIIASKTAWDPSVKPTVAIGSCKLPRRRKKT